MVTMTPDEVDELIRDLREWLIPSSCCEKRERAADVIESLRARLAEAEADAERLAHAIERHGEQWIDSVCAVALRRHDEAVRQR